MTNAQIDELLDRISHIIYRLNLIDLSETLPVHPIVTIEREFVGYYWNYDPGCCIAPNRPETGCLLHVIVNLKTLIAHIIFLYDSRDQLTADIHIEDRNLAMTIAGLLGTTFIH